MRCYGRWRLLVATISYGLEAACCLEGEALRSSGEVEEEQE
jgi:hypothetical protein